MFGNKKGSELSMNVIIIAAIALLVLVILSVLVLQRFGKVSEGTSCEGLGGICTTDGECSSRGGLKAPKSDCTDGYICCYQLPTSNQ